MIRLSGRTTVRGRKVEYDIDDFIANRSGAFNGMPREDSGTNYTCGYDQNDDDRDDPFQLTEFTAYSRPGEAWEIDWLNAKSGRGKLLDGQLRVVAFGRDRSRHVRDGQYVQSWGSESASFTLDTEFEFAFALLAAAKSSPRDEVRDQ